MQARLARTIRGWSVALLAGVLSASLHASAGGGFPAPAIVILAVLLAGLFSTLLVGRAPSLPRLTGAVAAGQLTFHTAFTTLGDPAGAALIPSPAGHHQHVTLAVEAAAHPSSAHSGPGMLLAHVVAGLASAVLMTCSERALAAMKRVTVLTLRRLMTALPLRSLPRPTRHALDVRIAIPGRTAVLGVLRYRGPPTPLRAA